MKVLITGGTGFTGSALVKRLLELGYQVRTLFCSGLSDGRGFRRRDASFDE